MFRVINATPRNLGLRGTAVSLDLPPGGFSDITDEQREDLLGNPTIKIFLEKGLVKINKGPLKQEIPLQEKTSDKQVPDEFKPVTSAKKTAMGTLEPSESSMVESLGDLPESGPAKSESIAVEPGKVQKGKSR